MNLFFDNKNILDYGIAVLDPTPILSLAGERRVEYEWADKSGIDKDLSNIRYDTNEFQLECICNATTAIQAHAIAQSFIDDFFSRGCVVVSLRDGNNRYCALCERSDAIAPKINVQYEKSLYYFKLSLRDVNPNALKFYSTVGLNGLLSVDYTKGKNAVIYWGEGSKGLVSNSKTYTYTSTEIENDPIDIIIDVDKTDENKTSLVCDFEGFAPTGIIPDEVQFTDLSTGNPVLWSWDFGDGTVSDEQNPLHTYTTDGVYTVKLQIFNDAQGSDIEIKTAYITVVRPRRIFGAADDFRTINSTDDYRITR